VLARFSEEIASPGKTSVIKMVRCCFFLSRTCSLIFFHEVIAAQSIANIVKSSLGPLGLDKMLVDNIGVRAFCIEFTKG
jgi:hypothetical protein